MADNFTDRLLLRQPEVNANQNLWGGLLNASFGSDLLDDAIVGAATYTLSGPKTLTRANGAPDEARKRVQHITGGTGGTVMIPAVAIWYWFINSASGPVTVTNGSTSVVVPAGSSTFVASPDGAALIVGLTKKYVDDRAFNTALPNQEGKAKQFLTTDGASAFFDRVSLAESVKDVLPEANGGTGLTSLAALKTAIAGWTQIGDPIAASGSAAVTFSNIPQNYSDILVVTSALSTTATANIAFGLSDGNPDYVGRTIFSSAVPSANYYGGILVTGYKLGAGIGVTGLSQQNQTRWVAGGGEAFVWRCPSVTTVQVLVGTGAFDAGTLTLYGR